MSHCQKHGIEVLQDSLLNKSTAFTEAEKRPGLQAHKLPYAHSRKVRKD
jgi:hypothetical protein